MAKNIQVVHPVYADGDQAGETFWANIAADPMAIVLVEPVLAELELDICGVSVFSNYALAFEHAKALKCLGAIIIPKRLDEPRWGNTAVN